VFIDWSRSISPQGNVQVQFDNDMILFRDLKEPTFVYDFSIFSFIPKRSGIKYLSIPCISCLKIPRDIGKTVFKPDPLQIRFFHTEKGSS